MRRSVTVIVLAVTSIAGCSSQVPPPTGGQSSPANPTVAVPAKPAAAVPAPNQTPSATKVERRDGESLTKHIAIITTNADGANPRGETFQNMDAAKMDATKLQEKVKALDWTGENSAPQVILTRDTHHRFAVFRDFERAEQKGSLIAEWLDLDGEFRSPPIDSPDVAIALVVSYFNNDGQWRNLVQWRESNQ